MQQLPQVDHGHRQRRAAFFDRRDRPRLAGRISSGQLGKRHWAAPGRSRAAQCRRAGRDRLNTATAPAVALWAGRVDDQVTDLARAPVEPGARPSADDRAAADSRADAEVHQIRAPRLVRLGNRGEVAVVGAPRLDPGELDAQPPSEI